MDHLGRILRNDTYVRKIDLRDNAINSDKDILSKDFIAGLYTNDTILNIDLRSNKGHSPEAKRKLALCMIKNIDKARQSQIPVKPSWIESKILAVENIKMSEILSGVNFVAEEEEKQEVPVKGRPTLKGAPVVLDLKQ